MNYTEQPAKQSQPLPHRLTLEDRRRLSLTGVTEVDSFDENTVILRTAQGMLVIRGEGLQLKNLNLDGGQAAVDGTVHSLTYEAAQPEGGLLRRLFG